MFENDTNADETVSRRSVLKQMGGLIAGSTALAGLGSGRGAAETKETLQVEIEEMNEERVAVGVHVPEELADGGLGVYLEEPTNVWLGQADQFIVEEGENGRVVSLPEDSEERFAAPVEMDEKWGGPGGWHAMVYFRTRDIDFSEVDGEEVTLGLGVFSDRTIPGTEWDTDSVRFIQSNPAT